MKFRTRFVRITELAACKTLASRHFSPDGKVNAKTAHTGRRFMILTVLTVTETASSEST